MVQVEVPRGTYVNKPINSFSSGDILRIIANNTTKEERLHIIYFFMVVVPITGFLTDVLEAITLLFKPSNIIIKLLKFLNLFDNIVQRFNPINASLLIMLLPEEPRMQAKKLLSKLKRDLIIDE
mgnify:FL=1